MRQPVLTARAISLAAGVALYAGGIASLLYLTYTAVEGRFVLVHALLAVLALLVLRLVQVWYRVKALGE
jgi:hypothetical protein